MSSAECLLLEPSDAELEASALGEIHFTDAGTRNACVIFMATEYAGALISDGTRSTGSTGTG